MSLATKDVVADFTSFDKHKRYYQIVQQTISPSTKHKRNQVFSECSFAIEFAILICKTNVLVNNLSFPWDKWKMYKIWKNNTMLILSFWTYWKTTARTSADYNKIEECDWFKNRLHAIIVSLNIVHAKNRSNIHSRQHRSRLWNGDIDLYAQIIYRFLCYSLLALPCGGI